MCFFDGHYSKLHPSSPGIFEWVDLMGIIFYTFWLLKWASFYLVQQKYWCKCMALKLIIANNHFNLATAIKSSTVNKSIAFSDLHQVIAIMWINRIIYGLKWPGLGPALLQYSCCWKLYMNILKNVSTCPVNLPVRGQVWADVASIGPLLAPYRHVYWVSTTWVLNFQYSHSSSVLALALQQVANRFCGYERIIFPKLWIRSNKGNKNLNNPRVVTVMARH